MSTKLYEMLGRKQERIDELERLNREVLQELANVVSGGVERSRLLINLTDGTWERVPKGERPMLPMQINGLPRVVVAPQEGEPQEGSETVALLETSGKPT